jgi:hypothetical protein
MERLKELITQLKEQLDRKAEPAQMLDTARLLEAELQLLASQPAPARVMPTKIAVMMPSATKMYAGQHAAQSAPQVSIEQRKDLASQRNNASSNASNGVHPDQKKEPVPAPASPAAAIPVDLDNPDSRYMPPAPTPVVPTPTPVSVAPVGAAAPVTVAAATATLEKPLERGVWPFNPLADKPIDRFTLSQRSKEVNDVIGTNGASSLNDKLKSEVTDLKSALNDTPVRDLKKAIGVNDRYVFINQLFRGDEVMYERSLKTINGFRILPEAEYWMERELKVKLGWDENREATRHFYQLVKRRFS